jgi:hypothetical protein
MKKFVFITTIILFLFSYNFAQKTVVNEKGWKIPKTGKIEKQQEIFIEEIKTTENTLTINANSFIKLKDSKSCEIRRAVSYQIKNRIFAYKFSCVPFAETQSKTKKGVTNRKDYAGAIFHFYFVDNDGDSLFEIKYSSLKMMESLPSWVKKLK